MKFKDMPYKRVDYDKTAEQFKTLTKRVKEAKSGEELWEIHQEYYRVYQNMIRFTRQKRIITMRQRRC